jgi:hypothetical protein
MLSFTIIKRFLFVVRGHNAIVRMGELYGKKTNRKQRNLNYIASGVLQIFKHQAGNVP